MDTARSHIIHADARQLPLPDRSVHCCVTSPPYFGKIRYYGSDEGIGRESDMADYEAELAQVLGEVHRVLRPDGTVWLNVGDTYGEHRDLLLVPDRVAQAAKRCGFIVRNRITWKKTNAMPTPANNRLNDTTETVFLVVKKPTGYYFDHYPYMEPSDRGGLRRGGDVWEFSTTAARLPGNDHPAVFPPELPRRCILAATSPAGCCPACGAQYRRVVAEKRIVDRGGRSAMRGCGQGGGQSANRPGRKPPQKTVWFATTGWAPSCACKAGLPVPCTVLDPFVGSGTTVAVAAALGRLGIGIELNSDYAHSAAEVVAGADSSALPADKWLAMGDLPSGVTNHLPDDRVFCHGDLTWGAWLRLLPLLPPSPSCPKPGRPRVPDLDVVETIYEMVRDGRPWRSAWNARRRAKEWLALGILEEIGKVFAEELARGGKQHLADALVARLHEVRLSDT